MTLHHVQHDMSMLHKIYGIPGEYVRTQLYYTQLQYMDTVTHTLQLYRILEYREQHFCVHTNARSQNFVITMHVCAPEAYIVCVPQMACFKPIRS